tara:strand:- start:2530 stop:3318 length:789 start_codon:yes stop_codon:yes gene_type:complete
MKRFVTTTLLSFAMLVGLTSTGLAKDPTNQLQDIQGHKILRTKGKLVKQKMKLEFMPITGQSMRLIHQSQVVPVRVLGYGSGHFQWDMNGLSYEIKNYPWDNNHKPVSGIITNSKGQTQKFRLYAQKPLKAAKGESQARGNWVGELAFPGGAMLDFSVQVSGVAWTFANCSDGAAYMHVSYAGAPSQPATLMHCPGLVEGGAYTSSFFHWDNISGEVFFITLTGDTADGGNILQGQATISSLTNWTSSEGKFLLFRHQPFSL